MPSSKSKKPVNKDRFISKMFLRSVPCLILLFCPPFSLILTLALSVHLIIYSGDSVVLGTFLKVC